MATTKNKLVYDLLNIVRGGVQASSELISESQVAFWVDNMRAKLIRQDLDKKRSINPDLVQSLGCVDVEQVDNSECGCEEVDCKIVRTVNKVPRSLETRFSNLITSVGPVDTTAKRFSFLPYERAIWANNSRYTKNIIRAFLHNEYIYIMNAPYITKINIQGVFEDPEEASTFTHCSGEPCYTKDSPYPISKTMIEDLKAMILQTDFMIATKAFTDRTGDSSHDVEPNIQK